MLVDSKKELDLQYVGFLTIMWWASHFYRVPPMAFGSLWQLMCQESLMRSVS